MQKCKDAIWRSRKMQKLKNYKMQIFKKAVQIEKQI